MADPRLDPPRSMPTYAVRAPLVRWLREQSDDAYRAIGRYRVLDVGCGAKPYEPVFSAHAASYVGVDPVDNPRAELKGAVEDLPVDDSSFDVVLCNQVLEHCDDPVKAVSELRRVTAPGGRVLVTTHGVMPYHPSPTDYWRWTHAGLEKLFADNGSWTSVRVTPGAGTTACLGMLFAMYLDLGFRRVGLGSVARPLIAVINTVATGIDAPLGSPARARPRWALRELPHRRGGASVKTLVTGGGGFIGSNVVRALLERGDDVRVLDNFSTGSRRNLAGLDVEVVEGELRSYERVHNAVRGTEIVFHLGALGSVPRSVQDPLTSSAVNVEGTLNVQLAARDEGVRRVVFASSSSIYGNQSELPLREAMAPDPISPYGVAKLAAERYCVSFSRVYDSFETVVLRYFNVFGPRQDPTSQYAAVVPLFITAIAAGEPVTIFDDGEQSRDFTYVDNVVAANLLAADAAGANGRIFNISGGTPTSVNELAVTIGRLLGKPVERRYLPARPGDLRNSWADVSEARSLLGFEPRVELEEGLRRTAEYLLGGED